MVRTLPSAASPRLDFQRILAISFAMAVHALALLVLLLPLTSPPLPEARNAPEPERWKIVRPLPPTPLPPQPVQQPRTELPPRTLPAPVHKTVPVTAHATIDQGTLAADPSPAAIGAPDLAPAHDSQPLEGAALRYAVAPPPPYPRDAVRSNAQGTVTLRILVDVDGRPLQVQVERSSGHRSLDREAVRHVQQRWRFEPATRDGRPVQAWGLVPIDFSLQ